jgi:NAD(P)-dependent dehydrogenase (short-subunit alcohol dehydrogenase family)
MDWLNLTDRVAVVTGASGGIGLGIAAGLAEAGAAVVMLDREPCPDDAIARVSAPGGRVAFVRCDVTSDDSVQTAAKTVAAFGDVSVLVNNAGTMRAGALEDMPLADWDAILALNLTGYLRCARAFGSPMLARGEGSIVHVASISSYVPQAVSGAYSVSKAGVVMLSRQLALEWGPRGVRSNVVSPGLIRTPMTRDIYQAQGVEASRRALVPRRRIGEPADIANAVVFLASERSDYITGEDIVIDGGFTRTMMSTIPRPGFGAG